jgi:hypothetical protein
VKLVGIQGELIWSSGLDEKYRCTVTREDAYSGTLRISLANTDEELTAKPVGLSYGAVVGPDMADVQEWQEFCISFVDALPQ